MKRHSLLVYDGVGLAVTIALVALGAWCGLHHAPQAAAHWRSANSDMNDAQGSLRTVEAALHKQQSDCRSLEQDIENRGALPSQSPVESDLQTIAKLARDNRMELARVVPLETKSYPGITESKYAIESRAAFAGLLGFLRDFHESAFWADITELSIDDRNQGKQRSEQRSARFVVSLFASDAETEPEGATR